MATTLMKPQEERKISIVKSDLADSAEAGQIHLIRKPGILVVIPCFNEEVSIGSVVLRAYNYADRVVVIDDGSRDRTADVARMAGAEVLRHEVNQGKGAGIRRAFEYAIMAGADILVLIDGDGQHNPDEIPRLIEPILKREADMVNGSRFLAKNSHHVPAYRRIGQDVLTLVTNAGAGHRITDSQNGFRAFARNTFGCFSFRENGMAIESEMLMDAAGANLRIKEVQIDVRYDVAGSTYNPVVHGFSVLLSVLGSIARRRQAMFYGLTGLVMLIAGTVTFSLMMTDPAGLTDNIAIGITTLGILCIVTGVLCIFTVLTLQSVQKFIQKT
ncbi:MAG: Glycosyltransferase AglJ [Methanocella sp. PtaU1.Bin125]|nr:MAG: Glycosyltransferase AglJ [Methanocella sp. PtaU1.Bin125]